MLLGNPCALCLFRDHLNTVINVQGDDEQRSGWWMEASQTSVGYPVDALLANQKKDKPCQCFCHDLQENELSSRWRIRCGKNKIFIL